MKRKKVALVVNPRAGQNLAKPSDVLAVLAAAGWRNDLALKEHGGQTMDLKAASKARDHFLLMAGLGIDVAVIRHVSKPLKYQVGALAVGVSAAKETPTQHPFPVEIRAGDSGNSGVLWKGKALQVVIGNTRHYAGILQVTPEAYIDDGILDVCHQQLSSILFLHLFVILFRSSTNLLK